MSSEILSALFKKCTNEATEAIKEASEKLEDTSFDPDARIEPSDKTSDTEKNRDDHAPDSRSDHVDPDNDNISSEKEYDPDNRIGEDINEKKQESNADPALATDNKEKTDNEGLTDAEKQRIKDETGWSDEIIDAISSWDEYEIYKKAGLVEAEIGGKKCLIRNDIDWEQKDAFGRTNKERAEQGLAPLSKDGKPLELHHIGQHPDSPLAELTHDEHHCNGNDGILHDKNIASEIDRSTFANERSQHWQERVNEGEKQK